MWRYYVISRRESSFVTFSGVNVVCSVPLIRSCKQKKILSGRFRLLVASLSIATNFMCMRVHVCVEGSVRKCFQLTHCQRNGQPSSVNHKDPITTDPICPSLFHSKVSVSVQLIVECLPMANIKTRDSGRFQICCSLGVDRVKSSLFFLLSITVEEVWRWQKFSLELFQDGVASLSGQEKEISARPVYSHINHCGSGKNKGLCFPGLAPFPDAVMHIYTFL